MSLKIEWCPLFTSYKITHKITISTIFFVVLLPSALHTTCGYTLSQKASDQPSLADTSLFLQPQYLYPNLIYSISCKNPPLKRRVWVTRILWDGRRTESIWNVGRKTKNVLAHHGHCYYMITRTFSIPLPQEISKLQQIAIVVGDRVGISNPTFSVYHDNIESDSLGTVSYPYVCGHSRYFEHVFVPIAFPRWSR